MKYTRKEIERMPSGNELDRLIAAWLGWELRPDKRWGGCFFWFDTKTMRPSGWLERDVPNDYNGDVFKPSTDIAHAFLVWDRLVEMERYPTLHEGPCEYRGLVISNVAGVGLVNPNIDEIFAEEKAHAICLAALLTCVEV